MPDTRLIYNHLFFGKVFSITLKGKTNILLNKAEKGIQIEPDHARLVDLIPY